MTEGNPYPGSQQRSRFGRRKRRYGIAGALCAFVAFPLGHRINHWAGASPENTAWALYGLLGVVAIALLMTRCRA